MAWLLGLADKAENILNKIDKNTAAALNKNKYDTLQPELTDVTWIPPQFGEIYREEGIAQLKMSDTSPRESITKSIMFSTIQSSSTVECPTDDTNELDSASRASMHNDHSSPDFLLTSAETSNSTVPSNEIDVQSTILYVENDTQKHENAMVNVQLTDANTVNVSSTLEEGLDIMQEKYKSELSPRDMDVLPEITLSENTYAKRHLKDAERRLEEKNMQLGKQTTDHQKEIVVLNGKLQSLEAEKSQLSKQVTDLQTIIEKTRFELQSTRSELEQHRARALRILQDKEKLIAELRSNESTGMDDATVMELNQLRQERDNLREEVQQIHKQLKLVRDEQSNAEFALEKIRQKSIEANIQAQEIFATERQKRLVAEEDARVLSEELRSSKDEIIHQRNNYTIQLQKQESEISRLRLQLSTASIPNSEIESRLATLTQTLVLKQQALESSTTERNALRLQLEKIEHEFRAALRASRRNVLYNNMNDTDDAKAQVPTFFMETPFDTGVTRRVKRVYSTLDAISVRTGVFLRRYPLARILVLIYMAILQLWVLVVLLSQSPEVH